MSQGHTDNTETFVQENLKYSKNSENPWYLG